MSSPETEYLKWRRQHPIGCVFARLIASDPGRYEQRVVRLPQLANVQRTAERIEEITSSLIADAKTSSLALTMPDLNSLELIARTMWELRNIPGWHVTPSLIQPPPQGDFVALNITRTIPFGDGECASEALVLGPYEIFPPTRRSPVAALEIYVGIPRPNGPLNDKPIEKANLAHIELNLPAHATFEIMWDSSKKGRLASLGGPDNRAKAKVSLTLPLLLAQQIGCAP